MNVAMESFSCGICENIPLICAPTNLFQILLQCGKRESMLSASLYSDEEIKEKVTSQDLVRGHSYSITKVAIIDINIPNLYGKLPMIRIRNPWGEETEWNGPWSDGSPEWNLIPKEKRKEIGLVFENDGEFWMTFHDFLRHFDVLRICSFEPNAKCEHPVTCKHKWEASVFKGNWSRKTTTGGMFNFLHTFSSNPQYMITLEEPDEFDVEGKCTMLVNLIQKEPRSDAELLKMGVVIFSLNEGELQPGRQSKSFFDNNALVAQSDHQDSTQVNWNCN